VVRRVARRLAAVLLAAASLCVAASAPAVAQQATDQEVKAAFLFQFTRFVEWPLPVNPPAEFVVAILGADQFSEVAARLLQGKTAADLPVAVRRIAAVGEAGGARILFVGSAESAHVPEILKGVEGAAVLTVSDSRAFAERGGMIGFRTEGQRVRFDINVVEAQRSGLRISSDVLRLARLVETRSVP
jgi:hypothetical protein